MNYATTPAKDRSVWPGSSWDRACRELFAGDERRMLAWGRRYLAAYPRVHGERFHLGARFRDIVGARNRAQWWRTAVELLARRTGGPASVVSDTSAPPYGADVALSVSRGGAPVADAAERLRIFDAGTERQRRRERGLAPTSEGGPPAKRGWTRQDLYE